MREEDNIKIDDRVVRLIGVPFFGMVIPSATGLINFEVLTTLELVFYYIYFIFVAWIVWEGNRYLREHYFAAINSKNSPIQKHTLMIGLNVFYTTPVSLLLLFGWKWISRADYDNHHILVASMTIIVSVIFITNVYEKIHYSKIEQLQKVKFEQLERTKVEAELTALKNQVDPHFMFNALNSLSYLIEHDPKKAVRFTDNLAEVYRYILRSKDKNLVLLQDEIDFMKLYASLLELRYENAFTVNLNLYPNAPADYLIPPVSMMVAVENAVKHNEVSQSSCLTVDINIIDNKLQIRNKLQKRKSASDSTKTGLKNLDERFTKILGNGIIVLNEKGYFILQMPLLKLSQL